MSHSFSRNGCNLCGAEKYSLLHREPGVGPDKIVQCLSCGFVYAILVEMRDSNLAQSSQKSIPWNQEEAGCRRQARLILSQIARHKNHGHLLQIGGEHPYLLEEARTMGYQASEIGLADWTALEKSMESRQFDVIVLNEAASRLSNFKWAMQEVRRILKNDGILYLSAPDINSFWSRILGARWWGMRKRHRYYFSKDTLGRFFKVVGFKPVRYYSYPRVYSLRHWIERLKMYPAFVRAPLEAVSKIGKAADWQLKVVLYDQLGVIAKKIQRLDSVIVDEAKREIVAKKQKVVVVLPAYNAEKTLERTVADIPRHCVDEIVLVDDCSRDKTVEVAKRLGLTVVVHPKNRGYGGNQKTCYETAMALGADIAVMCHPDYQYDPTIIPQLIEPIQRGQADAVFGSRMMKGGALEGGMPLWKHNANILLTALENVVLGTYLTEYHTGFRAYSTRLLKHINLEANSDNFIFDTEIIAQILANHFKIEEVPIRTRYFEEASSIKLWPSIVYGCGILRVMVEYVFHSKNWIKNKKFLPRSS